MTARDTSREETDWIEARRLYEAEGFSLREIAAAVGGGHERVRRRVIAEGWERDDEAVAARDVKRRKMAEVMVTGNLAKWATRRADEADEAGATAKVARERAIVALVEGDPQMARAATGVYLVMVEKAQLLTGGVTGRIAAVDEMQAHAEAMFDELAARRAS